MRYARILPAAMGAVLAVGFAGAALAYDGTNCKAPGNCWEPKPGYPAAVAGTKYDPKHDPMELNKQQESIEAMQERNELRVEYFAKTGVFIYDIKKIPAE